MYNYEIETALANNASILDLLALAGVTEEEFYMDAVERGLATPDEPEPEKPMYYIINQSYMVGDDERTEEVFRSESEKECYKALRLFRKIQHLEHQSRRYAYWMDVID